MKRRGVKINKKKKKEKAVGEKKKNLPVRSVTFPPEPHTRSPTPGAGDAVARRDQDVASARCADIINEFVCLLPLLPLST